MPTIVDTKASTIIHYTFKLTFNSAYYGMISQEVKLSKSIEPEHFSVVLYREVLAFKFVN